MRTSATIALLFIAIFGHSQNNNQMTENGQKTGKWITYLNNGKISIIKYYKPITKKYSKEDSFFYGLPANLDTIIYSEELLRQEVYKYDSLWNLSYVLVDNTDYYYGPNQELKFNDKNFHLIERTGKTYYWKLTIENSSDKSIEMRINFNASKYVMGVDYITINSNSIDTVTIPVNIPNGLVNDKLILKNDSIEFIASFHSFGYDINTLDIISGDKLSIKKSFWYYRLGEETLMKVYSKNKDQELQVIPITADKMKIDLDLSNHSEFRICIFDFKNDAKYYITAILAVE